MARNRIVVFAALVVIAGGLVYFATGHRIPPQGAQGSIGAAQRYDAQQLGNGDVQLTDAEIQAFLQSDTFHKIAVDPAFRAAVKSGDIAKLAANDAFRDLIRSNDQFAVLLTQAAFLNTAASHDFGKVTSDQKNAEMIFSDNFVSLMGNANFRAAMMDQRVFEALQAKDMSKAMDLAKLNYAKAYEQAKSVDQARVSYDAAKTTVDAARSTVDAGKIVADASKGSVDAAKGGYDASKGGYDASKGSVDAAKNMLDAAKVSVDFDKAEFQKMVDSQQFQALLGNADFARLATSGSLDALVRNDNFVQFLNSPALAQLVSADQSRAEFLNVVSSDAFQTVAARDGFVDLMANKDMMSALANDAFMAAAQKGGVDMAKALDMGKNTE
jgi:hypothetical protein